MTFEQILLAALSIVLSILGFFLKSAWAKLEKQGDDIHSLKIAVAVNTSVISRSKDDLESIDEKLDALLES
jgi:hypothetical protein